MPLPKQAPYLEQFCMYLCILPCPPPHLDKPLLLVHTLDSAEVAIVHVLYVIVGPLVGMMGGGMLVRMWQRHMLVALIAQRG